MYKSTGFISFFLRRLTGLALVFYLSLHILAIGSVTTSPDNFDNVQTYRNRKEKREYDRGWNNDVVRNRAFQGRIAYNLTGKKQNENDEEDVDQHDADERG